jgi:hypothetical protein
MIAPSMTEQPTTCIVCGSPVVVTLHAYGYHPVSGKRLWTKVAKCSKPRNRWNRWLDPHPEWRKTDSSDYWYIDDI